MKKYIFIILIITFFTTSLAEPKSSVVDFKMKYNPTEEGREKRLTAKAYVVKDGTTFECTVENERVAVCVFMNGQFVKIFENMHTKELYKGAENSLHLETSILIEMFNSINTTEEILNEVNKTKGGF